MAAAYGFRAVPTHLRFIRGGLQTAGNSSWRRSKTCDNLKRKLKIAARRFVQSTTAVIGGCARPVRARRVVGLEMTVESVTAAA